MFISDGTRELWKASEQQNHMVSARSSGSPGRRFGVNGGAEAGDRGYACIHSFIHSRNVKGSQSFRAHSFMQQVMAKHLLFAQHVLEARVLK